MCLGEEVEKEDEEEGGGRRKHCSPLSSFRGSISEGFVSCSDIDRLGFQPSI